MPTERVFHTPEKKAQFDAICDLARNKDTINLSEMIRTSEDVSGDCFSDLYFIYSAFISHCYTPIMALAMEGEYEAVELLLKQYSDIGEDCYIYKKMQAIRGYVYGSHIDYLNQLIQEKNATPEQVAISYKDSKFFNSYTANFKSSGLEHLVKFIDNEPLRKLLIDKYYLDSHYHYHYSNCLRNRLLNEAKSANQFIRSCHIDWSSRAWLPQYNVLFLEVIPHLMKNIPEEIVCICMSFIVPFSENKVLDFLKKQSEIPPRQSSWRMGCHTLFLKKATLRLQDPPNGLFITKSELADCLSYFSIRSLPDIKRLLQQENDNITYKSIYAALPKDGTTSRVIDAINRKFDEKLTAKVSELNH